MVTDERRAIPFPEGPLAEPWPGVLRWIAVAYTAVLLYATHHPRPESLIGEDAPSDKTLHFFAYGVLGGVVAAAVAARGGWKARTAMNVFVGLALFAAADEVTQPIFGRFADAVDWAFDEAGLVAGIAVTSLVVAVLGPSAAAWSVSRGAGHAGGSASGDQ